MWERWLERLSFSYVFPAPIIDSIGATASGLAMYIRIMKV